MIVKTKISGIGFLVFLSIILQSCTSNNINKYLHKDAMPYEVAMPTEAEKHAISLQEATLYAVKHLENRGVKNIKICEAEWITAPLGGFLIDGKGSFTIGGEHYTIFRIGIRDGSKENAGEEFVFMARGKNNKDKVIWYPETGPDFRPAEGEIFPEELLVYEFLGQREKFESLADRFK